MRNSYQFRAYDIDEVFNRPVVDFAGSLITPFNLNKLNSPFSNIVVACLVRFHVTPKPYLGLLDFGSNQS